MATDPGEALGRALAALESAAPGGPERAEALAALDLAVAFERDRLWASEPAGPRLRTALGAGEELERVIGQIERLAGTGLPALIEGPADGAQLVALAIHQTGAQRGGPLVRAWGPRDEDLSERWELARGGTLVVVEAGALSARAQDQLLGRLDDPGERPPRTLVTSRWEPGGVLSEPLASRLGLRVRIGQRVRVAAPEGEGTGAPPTLEEIELRAIAERLEACGWQQQRTADSLGIDRKTLYRKIRRHGLGDG